METPSQKFSANVVWPPLGFFPVHLCELPDAVINVLQCAENVQSAILGICLKMFHTRAFLENT